MDINVQLTEEEKKINLGGFPPIYKISVDLSSKRLTGLSKKLLPAKLTLLGLYLEYLEGSRLE